MRRECKQIRLHIVPMSLILCTNDSGIACTSTASVFDRKDACIKVFNPPRENDTWDDNVQQMHGKKY